MTEVYLILIILTVAGTAAGVQFRRRRTGELLDAAFFSMWRLSAPLIYPGARVSRGAIRGNCRHPISGSPSFLKRVRTGRVSAMPMW